MIARDQARCANEDCPQNTRCGRFSDDAAAYYASFAIGVDGECDGYIKKARTVVVGLRDASLAVKRRKAWKERLNGLQRVQE